MWPGLLTVDRETAYFVSSTVDDNSNPRSIYSSLWILACNLSETLFVKGIATLAYGLPGGDATERESVAVIDEISRCNAILVEAVATSAVGAELGEAGTAPIVLRP